LDTQKEEEEELEPVCAANTSFFGSSLSFPQELSIITIDLFPNLFFLFESAKLVLSLFSLFLSFFLSFFTFF